MLTNGLEIEVFDAFLAVKKYWQSGQKLVFVREDLGIHEKKPFAKLNFTQFVSHNFEILGIRLYSSSFEGCS